MSNSNIIKYRIISNTISSIIFMVVITTILIVFKSKLLPYHEIITLIYYFVLFYSVFNCLIEPFFSIKVWSYQLTDTTLEYTKGVFSVSKTIIPISRLQQVTIIKGPILNSFGLVKVEVLTTSKTHHLEHIPLLDGKMLAQKISQILHEKSKQDHKNATEGLDNDEK